MWLPKRMKFGIFRDYSIFAQFIVATRGRKVDCLAHSDQTCCSINSILRRCAGR